ncbi:hypothetical protein KR038_005151 [Drosophila bunnanda]|nr:hypothetical protein KR038_005151 [Drosophila bunnanda]
MCAECAPKIREVYNNKCRTGGEQPWPGSLGLNAELLLLHQVVHHGEVLVAQALLAQRQVHLVGQRAQRDGGVGGAGHAGGQAQILGDQGGGEAAGIVPVGGGSGADAGHRVVDLGGPAAAGGGVDDLGEDRGIQTLAHGQVHGLGHADHGDGQHHVVAELGGLSHAVDAAVCDPLAHALEDALDGIVLRLGAAHHEGEGGLLGAGHSAGDGGIDEPGPLAADLLLQRLDQLRRDRGGVNEDGVLVDAVGGHLLVRGVHDGVVRQHGDHEVRVLGQLRGLRVHGGPLGGQSVAGGLRDVEHMELVAGLDQVAGHVGAHVAQAHEADVLAAAALRGHGPHQSLAPGTQHCGGHHTQRHGCAE